MLDLPGYEGDLVAVELLQVPLHGIVDIYHAAASDVVAPGQLYTQAMRARYIPTRFAVTQ